MIIICLLYAHCEKKKTLKKLTYDKMKLHLCLSGSTLLCTFSTYTRYSDQIGGTVKVVPGADSPLLKDLRV